MPPGQPVRKHQGAFSAKVYIDDPVSPSNISIVDQDGKTIGGYAEAGVADDVKINAALAAYGDVLLPEGALVLNAAIALSTTGQRLRGAGFKTILKPKNVSMSAIATNNCRELDIGNFKIDGDGKTAVTGIGLTLTDRSIIHDISITNVLTGVNWISSYTGSALTWCGIFDRLIIFGPGNVEASPRGIVIGATSARAEYITVANSHIRNVNGSASSGIGILVGQGNINVNGCEITGCGTGIRVQNSSTNAGHGCLAFNMINHCESIGIDLYHVDWESIIGCKLISDYEGIIADTCDLIGISDNYLGSNSNYHMKLTAVTNSEILGNRIMADVTTQYGIRELGASDYNNILYNLFKTTGSYVHPEIMKLGANTQIIGNIGYIAPGEIRTIGGSIATLTENAFNSLDNLFGQDVALLSLDVYVATAATETSPNIDCGIGSGATTDYTTLFEDLPGETIGFYRSTIATPGTQTVPQLWQSGAGNRYLNMSIKDAAATGMVATYVATVMGL